MLSRAMTRFQSVGRSVDLTISSGLAKRSLLAASDAKCSLRPNYNWIISKQYLVVPDRAVTCAVTCRILFPVSKSFRKHLSTHMVKSNHKQVSDSFYDNSNRGTHANKNSRCLYSEYSTFDYKKQLGLIGLVGTVLAFGVSYIFDILATIGPSPVYASHNRHNFIADVVEKAAPSVVFLEIKGKNAITGKPVTLSNGSGFVVRKNGLILTNAHVVANKSKVNVKLQDGTFYEGDVTAVDPITDLATVKINANNLSTVPLGNSNDIRPGEWVIAMGSPLSLSNTVTCGIVSSVQRASKELGLRNKDMDYIQTDAVINFGNSGGPLVNLDGYAIGINTMKVTTGISFAIPADYAQTFLAKAETMMSKGITENAFLKKRFIGIVMLSLTQKVMRDLKSNDRVPTFPDVEGGVFVYKIIHGTPAHKYGLLACDIIVEINGRSVKSASDVYDEVDNAEILDVLIIRGGKRKTININTQETI